MTVDDEWAEPAAGWDDDPYVRAYSNAAFESLGPILADHSIALDGARVLDFGCGTGLMAEQLAAAGSTVDAVDTSAAMLDVLRDKISLRRLAGVHPSSSLPDPTGDHDVVVCSSVCAFLPDYPAAVVELVARLRPGGVFVQWDWERSAEEDLGLTRDEIRSALTTAGLAAVTVETGFDVDLDGASMRPLVGYGQRSSTH